MRYQNKKETFIKLFVRLDFNEVRVNSTFTIFLGGSCYFCSKKFLQIPDYLQNVLRTVLLSIKNKMNN